MLRIHLIQHCYNLSDEGMEDVPYETTPIRQFAHLSLDGTIPDRNMNFRHLLEHHHLARKLFGAVEE